MFLFIVLKGLKPVRNAKSWISTRRLIGHISIIAQ